MRSSALPTRVRAGFLAALALLVGTTTWVATRSDQPSVALHAAAAASTDQGATTATAQAVEPGPAAEPGQLDVRVHLGSHEGQQTIDADLPQSFPSEVARVEVLINDRRAAAGSPIPGSGIAIAVQDRFGPQFTVTVRAVDKAGAVLAVSDPVVLERGDAR